MHMQNKPAKPVPGYYYSASEWDRLGCGPLPPERDLDRDRAEQHQRVVSKGNPQIDGKHVKGYN